MDTRSHLREVTFRGSFLGAVCAFCIAICIPHAAFGQVVELVPVDQRDVGSSLAMSGEYVLIGAPGVNRIPGAAYIARRYATYSIRGPQWVLSSGVANDPQFGRSVAFSGTVAVVGADRRVHVYEQGVEGEWALVSVLESPRAEVTSTYGAVVAVGESQIAVSDAWIDGGGEVYRYERGDAGWSHVETLESAEASPEARLFGRSLAFAGDDLLIGAERVSLGLGAVYVYRAGQDQLLQHQILLPPEGAESVGFGAQVAADVDRIAVAAPGRDGDAADAAAVYLFERDDEQWSAAAVLRPTEPDQATDFAASVALDQDWLIVGARGSAFAPGRVVLYSTTDEGSWQQLASFVAPTPSEGDSFGQAVAIDGPRAVIGSREDGGTVYDFVRDPDAPVEWKWRMTTTSALLHNRRDFGRTVSAAGGLLVVGGLGSATGVHVFRLDGGAQEATHLAVLSAPAPSTWFGYAVSTDGQQIIVGQDDAAFVYEQVHGSPDAWRLAGTLTPPRTVRGENSQFQWVSIDDWIAVVGRVAGPAHVFERDEQGKWQHVSVLETENGEWVTDGEVSGERIVAADRRGLHVFVRRDWGYWERGPYIRPTDLPAWEELVEVAFDDGTIAVAARGRLWIYERMDPNVWNETWVEAQQLETLNGRYDLLRPTVDLQGDRLIIGSLEEDEQAQPGAVVYGRGSDGLWSMHHRIVKPAGYDRVTSSLGQVVSIDGDVALLGDDDAAFAFDVSASTVAFEPEPGVPGAFVLHGNYPNPFNPATTIIFDLAAASSITIEVVDLLGRRVLSIDGGTFEPGTGHAVRLDASSLPSGTYFYRLTAGAEVGSGKMTLVR